MYSMFSKKAIYKHLILCYNTDKLDKKRGEYYGTLQDIRRELESNQRIQDN